MVIQVANLVCSKREIVGRTSEEFGSKRQPVAISGLPYCIQMKKISQENMKSYGKYGFELFVSSPDKSAISVLV